MKIEQGFPSGEADLKSKENVEIPKQDWNKGSKKHHGKK